MEENIVKPITNTIIAPTPQVVVSQPSVELEQPIVEEIKTKTAAESVIKSTIPYQIDPLFHEVADYFNIDQKDWDSAKTKLGAIVDFIAQSVDSGDAGDILLKLREIEEKIQRPGWDEKRYTNVYKYVRLAQQRSSIDKAMGSLQRGGF